MTEIDSVIILGAGASASEGAPVQKTLIKEFLQYATFKLIEKEGLTEAEKNQLDQINKYFNLFWGADLLSSFDNRYKYPSFEDCLGILDVAKNRNENFQLKDSEELNSFRNSLIFLIAKSIENKLLNSKSNHHEILIDRLSQNESIKSTAFVSLNYDIIIDNELTKIRDSQDLDLDYGIEFMNFDRNHNLNEWMRPYPQKSVLLFKLHGSLNWLYCPTCNQIEITPKEKGVMKVFTESKECFDCGTPMKPIIVPPTYFKEMQNLYLQQIFQKTDKVLRNSKEIFICGYSLPDADLHIKYLLKRAELLNRNKPKIFIINNHQGKKDRKKEEKRFLQFFKFKGRVEYTELSFEDFCREGIPS